MTYYIYVIDVYDIQGRLLGTYLVSERTFEWACNKIAHFHPTMEWMSCYHQSASIY